MAGQWFFPVSSTNKTDCHDITEILLKVILNTIEPGAFFFTLFNLHSKRLFHANYNYFPFLVLEYSFLNLFSCSLCKTLDHKALNPTDLCDFICASLNLFIKMMFKHYTCIVKYIAIFSDIIGLI